MAVKIVADSASDIPADVAEELGITVVPLYVRFENDVYRDGVDLTPDEFYHKLVSSPSLPKTSQPSAGDFAQVYHKLAEQTDEILSIHVSSKLSGTYGAALLGSEGIEKGCHIEVVDTLSVSMGSGLLAIAAAKAAQAGETLQQIANMVRQSVPRIRLLAFLDTLKYVEKGGRIGKAASLLGTLLSVKPLVTLRDGELHPVGLARSRLKAIERLCEFVRGALHAQDVAIMHSTLSSEAQTLAERISSLLPKKNLIRARFGPVLGTHTGPGAMAVALGGGEGGGEQGRIEGESAKAPGSSPRSPRRLFRCSISRGKPSWAVAHQGIMKIDVPDAVRGEPFGKLRTGLSNHERPFDRLSERSIGVRKADRANVRKPIFGIEAPLWRQLIGSKC